MDTRAFDAGVVLSALPQLLEFLDITLLVGISSIVLGSLLGGALAWAKLSQLLDRGAGYYGDYHCFSPVGFPHSFLFCPESYQGQSGGVTD